MNTSLLASGNLKSRTGFERDNSAEALFRRARSVFSATKNFHSPVPCSLHVPRPWVLWARRVLRARRICNLLAAQDHIWFVVRLGVIEGEYHWHKHDEDDERTVILMVENAGIIPTGS